MCIKLLHLRKDLSQDITLPANCFYVGNDFMNLSKSLFYMKLPNDQYKRWLWSEIKVKTLVYQELTKIKTSIIMGNDVILACSCDTPNSCNGQIVKKAISYLLEQERLSAKGIEPTSWEEYRKIFSVAQDKLHDFAFWLNSNTYYEEKLNFYELWISFICHRHIA